VGLKPETSGGYDPRVLLPELERTRRISFWILVVAIATLLVGLATFVALFAS
jgi:hypothetical protein